MTRMPYGSPPPPAPAPASRGRTIWVVLAAALAGLVVLLGGCGVLVVAGLLASRSSGVEPRMTTYTAAGVAFEHPASWTERDDGNVVHLNADGTAPREHVTLVSADKDDAGSPLAILEYESTEPPAERPTADEVATAMQDSVLGQRNASATEVAMMRMSAGHGCLGPVRYTDEPAIVEGQGLVAMRYGYTCPSMNGPITGSYVVGMAGDGAVHRMTVTALTPYWATHRDSVEHVSRSLTSTVD